MELRAVVAIAFGLAAGILGFAAGMGVIGGWPAAAAIAVTAAGLVGWWVFRGPGRRLDPAACPGWLKVASCLTAVAALAMLGRLAVFMVDPSQAARSIVPTSKWEVEHSCLTAYFVAAQAVPSNPNIYDNSLYSMPDDDPNAIRKARTLGPFKIDVYEYPPPFLLLPRALMALTPEFPDLRMVWFALSGATILLVTWIAAGLLGPAAGTRALLLSPLVWLTPATLSTLQKGNVQLMVIAAAVGAMALFERRRRAAGGALLAFVTVSKLYPGLLVVYLLARRQWRAVAWTAGLSAGFGVATLAAFGWGPYAAFLEHLPGLVGGEAFPAFRNPAATAINLSIPGLVFKLKLFGMPGMSFGASKIVGWAYTLVALAATVAAGRRNLREADRPLVWMAILILATLRSPFLPQTYGTFPSIWLLTLLAAGRVPTRTLALLVVAGWAALNVYWPIDWPIDPRLLAVAMLVPQVVTILLAVVALRRPRDVTQAAPALSSAEALDAAR